MISSGTWSMVISFIYLEFPLDHRETGGVLVWIVVGNFFLSCKKRTPVSIGVGNSIPGISLCSSAWKNVVYLRLTLWLTYYGEEESEYLHTAVTLMVCQEAS